MVYRGEHGAHGEADFQTRLGSIAFGSLEAANIYARESSTWGETAAAPR